MYVCSGVGSGGGVGSGSGGGRGEGREDEMTQAFPDPQGTLSARLLYGFRTTAG